MRGATHAASADLSRLAEALEESGQRAQVTTEQVIRDAAEYILAEMMSRVPVSTGKLRNSLGIRQVGTAVIIGPNLEKAPYAPYVEFDTKPHVIKAKNARMLRFKINGRTVYARQVNHPGTKGQRFVRDSFQAWVDSIGELVAQANISVIEEAAS